MVSMSFSKQHNMSLTLAMFSMIFRLWHSNTTDGWFETWQQWLVEVSMFEGWVTLLTELSIATEYEFSEDIFVDVLHHLDELLLYEVICIATWNLLGLCLWDPLLCNIKWANPYHMVSMSYPFQHKPCLVFTLEICCPFYVLVNEIQVCLLHYSNMSMGFNYVPTLMYVFVNKLPRL